MRAPFEAALSALTATVMAMALLLLRRYRVVDVSKECLSYDGAVLGMPALYLLAFQGRR